MERITVVVLSGGLIRNLSDEIVRIVKGPGNDEWREIGLQVQSRNAGCEHFN
jgi:hypothetical protein